jgi:hypothetical protein
MCISIMEQDTACLSVTLGLPLPYSIPKRMESLERSMKGYFFWRMLHEVEEQNAYGILQWYLEVVLMLNFIRALWAWNTVKVKKSLHYFPPCSRESFFHKWLRHYSWMPLVYLWQDQPQTLQVPVLCLLNDYSWIAWLNSPIGIKCLLIKLWLSFSLPTRSWTWPHPQPESADSPNRRVHPENSLTWGWKILPSTILSQQHCKPSIHFSRLFFKALFTAPPTTGLYLFCF